MKSTKNITSILTTLALFTGCTADLNSISAEDRRGSEGFQFEELDSTLETASTTNDSDENFDENDEGAASQIDSDLEIYLDSQCPENDSTVAQQSSCLAQSFCSFDNIDSILEPADCDALVALYENTNGSAWLDSSNWFQKSDISSWFGVEVQYKHVVSLVLPNNNLVGSIPDRVGNFSSLDVLDLSGNMLSGEVPDNLRDISALDTCTLFSDQGNGCFEAETIGVSLWLDENCAGWDDGCVSVCGDGVHSEDEFCDDGNVDNDDGCSAQCTPEISSSSVQGNGVCELDECVGVASASCNIANSDCGVNSGVTTLYHHDQAPLWIIEWGIGLQTLPELTLLNSHQTNAEIMSIEFNSDSAATINISHSDFGVGASFVQVQIGDGAPFILGSSH